MTADKNIIDDIIQNKNIQALAKKLAGEFANRNLAPLIYFCKKLNNKSNDSFDQDITNFYEVISNTISPNLNLLESISNKPDWLNRAFSLGKDGSTYNLHKVSKYICVSLIEQFFPTLDDQIIDLGKTEICAKLNIFLDKNMLVDLSDKQFNLKSNGIIYNNKSIVYPHQFLRKDYSDGFDKILDLLSKAKDNQLNVKIRLDQFRITEVKNYLEPIIVKDKWYGKPFNRDILMNSDEKEIFTIHQTNNQEIPYNPTLFTVFRSSMMDFKLRQFTVEEFISNHNSASSLKAIPGFGNKYCIQKFAHFQYDQITKKFNHFDGAIRVFDINEYDELYKNIVSGSRPQSKLGIRHKLFLIEGSIDSILIKDILDEFFNYNQHLQEYFNKEL